MRLAPLWLALAIAWPCSAQTPAAQVERLLAEDLEAWARRNPYWAESLEVLPDRDLLPARSLASQEAWAKDAADRLEQLEAIPHAALDPETRLMAELLGRELRSRVDAHRLGADLLVLTPLTARLRWWPPRPKGPLSSEALDRYERRLQHTHTTLVELRGVLAEGRRRGITPPAEIMQGLAHEIWAEASIYEGDTRASRRLVLDHPALSPYRSSLPRGDERFARAQSIVIRVVQELLDLTTYLREDYVPECRETRAATKLPNGVELYAWSRRRYGLPDMTADAIHQLGLVEVERIRAEMLRLLESWEAYPRRDDEDPREQLARVIDALRSDPASRFQESEELLEAFRQAGFRAERALEQAFHPDQRDVPAWELRADPFERNYPLRYFRGGPTRDGRGYLVVATAELEARSRLEVVPLTLHELVPGHHLQRANSDRLSSPWRRAAFQSYGHAYLEGWALYAEGLGHELGLYQDPADAFGRLSSEMWRALRLVIDTGLHAKGWLPQEAVDLLLRECAIGEATARQEVLRCLARPGHGLSYKLGELTLRRLRAEAEEALGEAFALADFHRAVLTLGELPLDLLERELRAWIAEGGG